MYEGPYNEYLNCGEWYEDMIDHHGYAHNLSSCEIKAWKKFRPEWEIKVWIFSGFDFTTAIGGSLELLQTLSFQNES